MSMMPVQRVQAFSLSVPKSTTKAAPATAALTFPDGQVVWVEIVIPTGHIGQTGVALSYGGQQVIPEDAGTWITSNGETIHWDLDDFPTGSQWQAKAFNLDRVNAHGFYFRFGIRELVAPDTQPVTVSPVPIA